MLLRKQYSYQDENLYRVRFNAYKLSAGIGIQGIRHPPPSFFYLLYCSFKVNKLLVNKLLVYLIWYVSKQIRNEDVIWILYLVNKLVTK